MAKRRQKGGSGWLEHSARVVKVWTGSSQPWVRVGVLIIWALLGRSFTSRIPGSSSQYRHPIVTFLMVFLIQRAEQGLAGDHEAQRDRGGAAGREQPVINVEDLTEHEVATLHRHYSTLALIAKRDTTLTATHSVEEAKTRAAQKRAR